MQTITIRDLPIKVPTEWNELSARQLVQVMEIIYGQLPYSYGILQLLKVITCLPSWKWNSLKFSEIEEFLYLPEFLVKESRLTKNLLATYDGWAGPASNFNNLLMAEFVFCEDYFLKYKGDEKDQKSLDNLVAVLYRPRRIFYNGAMNSKGDARIPFNENECTYRAGKKVAHWPISVKLAILTWYEACRLQMIEDFPGVFSGTSGEPAKYGLLTMMRNVAQSGVHGDLKAVEMQFLKMVMIELDEITTEAEAIEKLQKRH